MRFSPLALLLLLVAGCEGASFDDYTDRGTACVYAQRPAMLYDVVRESQTYPADTALAVEVFMGCAAGGCTSVVAKTCTVTQTGDVIEISTELETKTEGSVCTDDCQIVNVSCDIDPLPAGTYTVRYGPNEAQLEVGATQESPCIVGTSP